MLIVCLNCIIFVYCHVHLEVLNAPRRRRELRAHPGEEANTTTNNNANANANANAANTNTNTNLNTIVDNNH